MALDAKDEDDDDEKVPVEVGWLVGIRPRLVHGAAILVGSFTLS